MRISTVGFDLFFAMDVDKKRIALAVLDDKRLIRKMTLPYDPNNLINYVRKNYPGQRGIFVYEAGPTGYGLYDRLREEGEECEVAVTSMIPRAPGQRVKTNRIDAYNLGIQLRSGGLGKVNVPEKKYRDLRHLARMRLWYGKKIVASKNALKGSYLVEGIPFPEGKWSRRIISELKQLQYRSAVEFKVNRLLENLEFFRKQELKTMAEIRRFCRADKEIENCVFYLMSLPGIGWIISTYILGAFGGYKHLSKIEGCSVKGSCGFFGVVSRENSTGERVRKGEITAVGDPNARKMLVQASWIATRKDPEMESEYKKVFCRHNEKVRKQKAIVAVARKMVCRIHAVLRDQRPFEKRLPKTA